MHRVRPVLLTLLLAAAYPDPAIAQGRESRGVPVEAGRIIVLPGDLNKQRAEDIRRAFREALQRYPPSLGMVLKLDPSLMANPAYMAAYPVLVEFMKLHPEIARYPSYFLNHIETGYYYQPEPGDPATQHRRDVMNMWERTIDGISIFVVFLTVVFALAWLVKYFVGHRRWIRTAKVQTEVHSRLLERFSSNDELLAYVQSPAGARFLQALPAAPLENGQAVAAPVNRILWSVQAGLVLACGGIGLLFIKRHVMEEVAQMMFAMGTLGLSIGIGFALAAFASYLISHRLGLLNGTSTKA